MAYITIRQGERELGWRELNGPLTVGRQRECDICLIDSRLSRSHCRFEREGDDWAVLDLGSKNGTWCDGISIDRVLLLDGDRIYVGRLTFTFHEGPPPTQGKYTPRPTRRPADPREALEETIAGVTVIERPERPRDPWLAQGKRAQPRPMPRELRPEETGVFTAVLELPADLDESKPLRSYRPPRVRPLPRPILVELPGSPALDDVPRKRPAMPATEPSAATQVALAAAPAALTAPEPAKAPKRIEWGKVMEWMGTGLAVASVCSSAAWAAWQWWALAR